LGDATAELGVYGGRRSGGLGEISHGLRGQREGGVKLGMGLVSKGFLEFLEHLGKGGGEREIVLNA